MLTVEEKAALYDLIRPHMCELMDCATHRESLPFRREDARKETRAAHDAALDFLAKARGEKPIYSKVAPKRVEFVFPVDSAVPLPENLRNVGASTDLRAVLDSLDVGQSTTVPVNPKNGRAAVPLYNALRKLSGKRFTQRKQVESGEERIRVWRVE